MDRTSPILPPVALPAAQYPRALISWGAVTVFALGQVVSTVDRGMLALLIDPIRHDLHISDVQIALLQGFAFALFYVAAGLPLGFLADRVNRRRLLIAGVLVWSAATVACGYAASFGEMFLARLLVGLGEAALAPCAVTMIGDLFPPSRRGPPMALYVLGSMVAVGIGSAATGSILKLAPLGAFDGLPLLRGLAPWRTAFIVLGTCGTLIAVLVALLEEPARKGVAIEARRGLGLRQTLVYFSDNWKVLLPFYGAVATYGIGSALAMGWGPAVLIRTYGLNAGALGESLGADQFFAAILGAICAALVIDPVVRRAGTAGKLYLGALLAVLAIPSTIAYAANSVWLATAMTAEVMFVTAIYGSTMLSTMTELVPTNMKGISVSLYAFVLIMIGSTLGPLIAAQVNQALFNDPKMIGHAIALVGISALVLSAALTMATRWRFKKAVACNGLFARVLNANLQ